MRESFLRTVEFSHLILVAGLVHDAFIQVTNRRLKLLDSRILCNLESGSCCCCCCCYNPKPHNGSLRGTHEAGHKKTVWYSRLDDSGSYSEWYGRLPYPTPHLLQIIKDLFYHARHLVHVVVDPKPCHEGCQEDQEGKHCGPCRGTMTAIALPGPMLLVVLMVMHARGRIYRERIDRGLLS